MRSGRFWHRMGKNLSNRLHTGKPRVVVVASHPIQYQAHWFRSLAREVCLQVFYCHKATPTDQSLAGFGTSFDWDIDLLSGYSSCFLRNVSRHPSSGHFNGCDTPDIYEELRTLAPDLVIICGWYLKSFWQATLAAKRLGCTVAVRGDSHLGEPRSKTKQFIKDITYPIGLQAFDISMYVGKLSKEYFKYYKIPESKLCFVPHCVDENFFLANATRRAGQEFRQRHEILEAEYVVAFAGKLIPRKRVCDLIDAAAKLKERGRPITVLIAGSGLLETSLRARAVEVGTKVLFLGFQNQSQMPGVYAAANVLALPSDNESWGMVANEALASGTPLLISDAVGCGPDLAGDGRAGQLYACGDINDLADKLEHLISKPPKQDDILETARRYGVNTATSNVVALAYSAIDRLG